MRKFTNIENNKVYNIREQIENIVSSENEEVTVNIQEGTPQAFFNKIIESIEMGRIFHLTAKGVEGSTAITHAVLDEYIHVMTSKLDELVEVYQGQYGIVSDLGHIDANANDKDHLAYYTNLVDYLRHARKCFVIEDSHLHSLVDDMIAYLYKCIYKIKFLR